MQHSCGCLSCFCRLVDYINLWDIMRIYRAETGRQVEWDSNNNEKIDTQVSYRHHKDQLEN